MATKIQFRRDTAENWNSADPVLYQGELGYETDTGKVKIGDGSTTWKISDYWDGGGAFARYGRIPALPVGAFGDKSRDFAGDENYLYYCIADYSAPTYRALVQSTTNTQFVIIAALGIPKPLAGWIMTYNDTQYILPSDATVTGTNWYLPLSTTVSVSFGDTITIGEYPTEVIWKRVAVDNSW